MKLKKLFEEKKEEYIDRTKDFTPLYITPLSSGVGRIPLSKDQVL